MAIGRGERMRGELLDSAYAWSTWIRHAASSADAAGLATGHLAPVLLLPGVYETWRFLEPLGRRLHSLGHPVYALPDLGLNLRSIPESAAMAQRYLESHDLREVVVLAHSKGGLIAKQMMVTDDREGRVSRLIAVNTPFAGSSHARFTLRRALREFHPEGPSITALDREIDANIRITSIYSERDPIIPAGSRLIGATNIDLPVVGHFRILSSQLLWRAVADALGHPAAT